LTAKRRSMKNNTLATLVYAKMNVDLLDNIDGSKLTDSPMFESVLDFVDAVIQEEMIEMLGSDLEAGSESQQQPNEIKSSDSDSGDAADW
jgi:hypothetical protein